MDQFSVAAVDHFYIAVNIDSSSREKSKFINALLNNASEYFENLDVPKTIESSIPCIAHLLATLAIFKAIAPLSSSERLDKLQEIGGVLPQVEAGMPGPCLIYMYAVLMSPEFNNFAKISLLSVMIANIEKNMNKFGDLGPVVLSVAINHWFSIEESLDSSKRALFTVERSNYEQFQSTYPEKDPEEMTFIDKCIIEVGKKLNTVVPNSLSPQVLEEKHGPNTR